MILELQARLAESVRAAARTAYGVELESVGFQYPPRLELGDLAVTAAFELAKARGQKPRTVAERLAAGLAGGALVARAEVAGGGYVNLFLDRAAVAVAFQARLRAGEPAAAVPGRTIVEHTSINPNKAAHVGHLRNATLGDSFVRILVYRGHEVGVQNYIDDTGVQLADVVVGFQHLEGMGLSEVEAIPGRFDYYCWDLYARVGDFYAEDPARKQLQVATLHAIERGEGDTARLAEHIADRIVGCHLATMSRIGVRYDLLARESDILRLHFWDRAFEMLKESGAIRLEAEGRNQGCWVLSMGDEEDGGRAPVAEASARARLRGAPGEGREGSRGAPPGEEPRPATDEDKIIVRSNGTVTYTGKDIAYQLWKLGRLDRDFHYRRYVSRDGYALWSTTSGPGEPGAPSFGHAQRVFNVIDVGQAYPQRVVKAGVAALGFKQAAEQSYHLAYEKVVLSPATARALGYEVGADEAVVKVSGRKGLGVKADDLIDALVAKAREEIEVRDPGRPAADRDRAAAAIAVGALRYFLLRYGRTRIITFDMEEALAFVGETGPYIQNAVVRARSILTRLAEGGQDVEGLLRAGALDPTRLSSTEEGDEVWGLLLLMARSEEVAEQAVSAQEVALLAKHCFALAQAFHSYYQKPGYSVLHAASTELQARRAHVVDAFVRQAAVLTELLGIPVPDRM